MEGEEGLEGGQGRTRREQEKLNEKVRGAYRETIRGDIRDSGGKSTTEREEGEAKY